MRENPFMSFNHIKIGVVESDHAEVWLDIQPESTNIYGVVHGGALFTMADCCAGLTARSDGREYVTQNASVSFVSNTPKGKITAYGKGSSAVGIVSVLWMWKSAQARIH